MSIAQNIFQLETPIRSDNRQIMNFDSSVSPDNLRENKQTTSERDQSLSKSYDFSDEEESKEESPKNQDHGCCEQDHIVFKDREKLYLRRLDYLDDHFDEDALNATLFPDNFRCASFSQSYNFMDNPTFNQANLVLDRVKTLLDTPLVLEMRNN